MSKRTCHTISTISNLIFAKSCTHLDPPTMISESQDVEKDDVIGWDITLGGDSIEKKLA